MPTAAFTTLGCKVNQYETQKILDSFEAAGYEVVPFDQPADVVVINTCSVTSDAESKSRYTIRRARRTSPNAKIVATGCAAQMSINKEVEMEGADLIVPNPVKLETFARFSEAFPEIRPIELLSAPKQPAGRTRATLKVQDGCSVHCSYCSIPFTRPGMVSRPAIEVLEEAKSMAERGYHEAVLTGVLIGAYGPDSGSGGPDFEDLVDLLAAESGLNRIRISSIEVHQVTDRLIEQTRQGKVVPHFHIPLQSGSTQVLKDMNRRYDQQMYLDLCQRVYDRIPDCQITTDIMVGFPTETREHFEQSLEVVRQVKYLKAHVFRFSPRFGTPADAWGDPVSPEEKQARAKELADAAAQTGAEQMKRFLGRTMEVVVERKAGRDGLMEGVTSNWLTIKFTAPATTGGTLQWVRIEEFRDGVLYGELTSRPSLRMA